MKKITSLLILMSIAAICHGQTFNEMINLTKYAKANRQLMEEGHRPRLVMIGNSVVEFWVINHPDFFTSNDFVGRGISGQTTPKTLARFRQDVIMLNPQVVLINVGTNDIAENTGPYDADFTFGNLVSLAQLAQANGIKVILSSVLPAAGFLWNPSVTDAPAKIDAMNARIKAYAQANNIEYIDFNAILRDSQGALKSNYGDDGVHPNSEAYFLMEQTAMPIIKKTIGKTSKGSGK